MKNQTINDAVIDTLTNDEIEQVAGGVQFGTLGRDANGGYEIVPTIGASSLYAKILGKWVPLGTEPFVGPAASELEG